MLSGRKSLGISGANYKLSCKIVTDDPNPQIVWTKDGVDLSGASVKYEDKVRYVA